MKEIWLHLPSWNKDLVTESIESGVDAIITEDCYVDDIKDLGRITVIAPEKGDLSIPKDVETFIINNKNDENLAASALRKKTVIVRTTDWDIIPIENLIPQGGERLFTYVRNIDDAKLATGIMENGVAGVVLETEDPSAIKGLVQYIKKLSSEKIDLIELEITRVQQIGIGDRVCVDTCSNLAIGEGMLVGNSSQGMFLVHAENIVNPYVSPRPFRVNAGAVHSYIKIPGDKTRYLGELQTGDPVLIVSNKGESYTSYVGRSKIEKRPMLVIHAKSDGKEYSVILQNAETIRLTDPQGNAVSVVKLMQGDKVMGYIEHGARHFGMAVEESIIEQ